MCCVLLFVGVVVRCLLFVACECSMLSRVDRVCLSLLLVVRCSFVACC